MKAYSLDLRKRVLVASQQPNRSLPQVAAQLSVSLSFVNKLLRRQRTSGSLAALPHAGGPCSVPRPWTTCANACASSLMPP